MKILDIKKKGNLVTFLLGESSLQMWGSPLWSIPPYQNSPLVEAAKVLKTQVIVFNFNLSVLQPHEESFGICISKQEMMDKKYPLLTITDSSNNKKEIFMGDDINSIPNELIFTQYMG